MILQLTEMIVSIAVMVSEISGVKTWINTNLQSEESSNFTQIIIYNFSHKYYIQSWLHVIRKQ